ncbi:Pvc16 family protein [Dysgonomonas sp. 25]|uniref:Pvc16 family protein n=1 Tax=Dysgonomonas sp. 25 TaxID=2302933 RepID=UPI0013D05670|nr:Pvc16 family protein [Dysgonomonas sp. 25]NDV67371.1 DUF4255 domain-containing protein [Dysgonomonas sp. 25]
MYTILSYLSSLLSDFLKTTFNLNEDIVCIQPLSNVGQSNNTIGIPQSSISFSIEPVNLSFNESSNLWSFMGGSYYPPILCEIRTLKVNSEEVKQLRRVINRKDITI